MDEIKIRELNLRDLTVDIRKSDFLKQCGLRPSSSSSDSLKFPILLLNRIPTGSDDDKNGNTEENGEDIQFLSWSLRRLYHKILKSKFYNIHSQLSENRNRPAMKKLNLLSNLVLNKNLKISNSIFSKYLNSEQKMIEAKAESTLKNSKHRIPNVKFKEYINTIIKIVKEQRKGKSQKLQILLRHFVENKSNDSEVGNRLNDNKDDSYKCEKCSKIFTKKGLLNKHLIVHEQFKPYKCETCSKWFKEKSKWKRHCMTHAKERPFICEICFRGYTRSRDLTIHMKLHNKENPKALFPCRFCYKSFLHKKSLIYHLRYHLNPHIQEKVSNSPAFTSNNSFVCQVCSNVFPSFKQLKNHKQSHLTKHPFKCETCSKLFASRGNLVRHRKIHTRENLFTCKICSKKFNRKYNLDKHKKIHGNKQIFSCSLCPKYFKQKYMLEEHTKSHGAEKSVVDYKVKRFACDLCPKAYGKKSNLTRHMKVHVEKET